MTKLKRPTFVQLLTSLGTTKQEELIACCSPNIITIWIPQNLFTAKSEVPKARVLYMKHVRESATLHNLFCISGFAQIPYSNGRMEIRRMASSIGRRKKTQKREPIKLKCATSARVEEALYFLIFLIFGEACVGPLKSSFPLSDYKQTNSWWITCLSMGFLRISRL